MYFENLSMRMIIKRLDCLFIIHGMRRSINCASAHQKLRVSFKIEPKSAVCDLLVSRANLLCPW